MVALRSVNFVIVRRFGDTKVCNTSQGTFNTIMVTLLPVYVVTPFLVSQVVNTGTAGPLYMFVGATFGAVFMACGIISTTPAYEAALFG